MKKVLLALGISLSIIALIALWIAYGSSTSFKDENKILLVEDENISKESLIQLLQDEDVVSNKFLFAQLGNQFNIWERVKKGKFRIKKGESILGIVRMFRNNKQAEFNLVINKIRLPEDLAKLIGKNFSTDSNEAIKILRDSSVLASIHSNSTSLLFNIIPNTYTFYWSTPVDKMLEKISVEAKKFWDEKERASKAEKLGLTPFQVYIIASIVEEETNNDAEKGNVASVYMNRLKIEMPLAADPTLKFGLKDFTLRRILNIHTKVNSPFNTYKNKGLPPGPICTPSIKTIDAVLNAPSTNYLFFVADAAMNGTHHFSSNFAEHQRYANIYHKALTIYLANKK